VKSLIIVNPAAGRGRALRVWRRLEGQCPFTYELHFTSRPGEATEVARQAAETGFQRIISIGGDGTIHEIANGLAGTGVALGIIPGGNGNDFARTMNLPRDPQRALRCVAEARVKAVDLGVVNGRYFVNVAGLGFDCEVVREVSRRKGSFAGSLVYLYAVFKTLASYTNADVLIDIDGTKRSRRVLMLAVANGRYYGGGMNVAPHARADDGAFDICVAGDLTRPEVVVNVPKMYLGTHLSHPKVEYFRGVRVRVESERQLPIQCDGELVGNTPAEFTVSAGSLTVIVP